MRRDVWIPEPGDDTLQSMRGVFGKVLYRASLCKLREGVIWYVEVAPYVPYTVTALSGYATYIEEAKQRVGDAVAAFGARRPLRFRVGSACLRLQTIRPGQEARAS